MYTVTLKLAMGSRLKFLNPNSIWGDLGFGTTSEQTLKVGASASIKVKISMFNIHKITFIGNDKLKGHYFGIVDELGNRIKIKWMGADDGNLPKYKIRFF